jgi:hypothetical protein
MRILLQIEDWEVEGKPGHHLSESKATIQNYFIDLSESVL